MHPIPVVDVACPLTLASEDLFLYPSPTHLIVALIMKCQICVRGNSYKIDIFFVLL